MCATRVLQSSNEQSNCRNRSASGIRSWIISRPCALSGFVTRRRICKLRQIMPFQRCIEFDSVNMEISPARFPSFFMQYPRADSGAPLFRNILITK